MTREEQIIKAAEDWASRGYYRVAPHFVIGATWADANRWVKVEEGLPQAIEGKMKPVLVLHGKFHVVAYYFPEHFKTVEWEDWDDYNEEDFPYTENDIERKCVWLRPGFYQSVDCDRCEPFWSQPLPVTHWMPLPEPPKAEQ